MPSYLKAVTKPEGGGTARAGGGATRGATSHRDTGNTSYRGAGSTSHRNLDRDGPSPPTGKLMAKMSRVTGIDRYGNLVTNKQVVLKTTR